MISAMCRRSDAGACCLYDASVAAASFASAENAIVRGVPLGDFAYRPPYCATPAMNPTLPGSIETSVNPFFVKHGAVAAAV